VDDDIVPAGNPEGFTYDAVTAFVAFPIEPENDPVNDVAVIEYPDALVFP
jgi:hypothetical protein